MVNTEHSDYCGNIIFNMICPNHGMIFKMGSGYKNILRIFSLQVSHYNKQVREKKNNNMPNKELNSNLL